MKDLKIIFLIMVMAASGFAGCSAEDRAEMEAKKLAKFDLTEKQLAVAEALIEGYKKEMGTQLLRSREYASAACYAKSVKMPSRFDRAHLAYLPNYPEADDNWETFFRAKGINIDAAYEMGQISEKAHEKC